ncbi:MAG: hypothetical protein A2Y79_04875 [Deltaproteobacteria bacterium RBG_13_43_22]|nr:MAG: hypothetical protein A2Y79_04875 [Deltaproteobacteria bacterium RBG_13_43_22]
MSCVRKRRGKWVIDFYDQFRKRHWETVGTSERKANKKLAERIMEVEEGTFLVSGNSKTFEEVAKDWFETQVIPKKRPKTARYYRNIKDNHLVPYFGKVKVNRIDFSLIEKYMSKKFGDYEEYLRKKEELEKKETKISLKRVIDKESINKTVTALGTILKYAARRRFIKSNPVPNVEKFRKEAGNFKEEKRFLTPEEIQLLLKQEDPKWGPIILTAVLTGMREEEILGLQWGDIDWNQGQIYINRTLQEGGFYNPKTKTSRRKIDIDPGLLTELKKWKLRCPKGEYEMVFPNSVGNPMDATHMLRRIFYPALSRAKVAKIRFHDLRHTNASLRIEAGQNPKYIQEQLGHSSIQVTMDIYGHLLRSTNQDAAIKLREIAFKEKEVENTDGSKMVAEG